MTKPKTFTVIGFYEYTGQVFAYPVRATDPHEAMNLAVNGDYIDMSDSSDVCVVAAVRGDVSVFAPCEDTGKIAYATDLLPEDWPIHTDADLKAMEGLR